MAALKVVKDRLDHFGLGLYCLEVHSAKASKTAVLKSICERMQYPRRIASIQEIENARGALHQARQRLTEYAALMNSPAGLTGLTTHQVLWGDFTRATPEPLPPKATMEFCFPEPLGIDRFKLGELVGACKALDNWAAGMGELAEPANQPWRGVGNSNLNRFDRAKAIEVVGRWSNALERLLGQADRLAELTAWEGLTSTSDISAATNVIALIPNPEPEFEEKILSLGIGEAARYSLSSWVELCRRAHGLEAEVCAVCSRQALDTNLDIVTPLVERANAAGIADVAIEQLPRVYEEAQESSEQVGRLTQLMVELLRVARRDSKDLRLDAKSEAMAAGYLHAVRQVSLENLRYRSPALIDESVIES
jgi:hypothetical protein